MAGSAVATIASWSLRAICSAGSSPKRLGSASTKVTASTTRTRMYFQRGYSSIFLSALEGALGHQRCDLSLLHLQAHPVGDLDGHEGITHFSDAAQNAAGGHDLITGSQLGDHVLVILGLLL